MKKYAGYTLKEIIEEPYIITGELDAIDIMKELAEENIKLRDTQVKLIELLKKADEYSDKLGWKLFWETKDKMIEEVNKSKK